MNNMVQKLGEHKEKLLFGFVVLVALLVALKAPFGGAGVEGINNTQRQAAISASGTEQSRADQILKQVKSPEPPKSLPLDEKSILRRFYDDRAAYKPSRSSAFVRGSESLERLAPLSVSFPGFPSLPDYELIAGPSPDTARQKNYVPRDTRPVTLTRKDTSEFGGDK